MDNYLTLKKRGAVDAHSDRLRAAPLGSWFFPDLVARASLEHADNPKRELRFRAKLCHRCNLIFPTRAYCHPMYGGRAQQQFGWYINQEYLRYGVAPIGYFYLPDVCPDDLICLIRKWKEAKAVHEDYDEHMDARIIEAETNTDASSLTLSDMPEPPPGGSAEKDLRGYYVVEARKEALRNIHRANRALEKRMENAVREAFGLKKIGEQWLSETLLYKFVCALFPGHEVIFHSQPKFLNGLELDIFVPHLDLGIEYQGQQHFHSVKHWGGEKALEDLVVRDKVKKELCMEHGVHLVYVNYYDPLNKDFVESAIDAVLNH